MNEADGRPPSDDMLLSIRPEKGECGDDSKSENPPVSHSEGDYVSQIVVASLIGFAVLRTYRHILLVRRSYVSRGKRYLGRGIRDWQGELILGPLSSVFGDMFEFVGAASANPKSSLRWCI